MSETIATAAIRVHGEVWTLPRPARHHVLTQAWSLAHYKDGKNGYLGNHESGFVTSEGSPEMRAKAADAGALFLIAKPFNEETFQEALSGVIA